ncbi:MAG: MBL fold metallo-hydrolase [Alphaproteobacteria bacterium]|nr:MBL fold metallo-hydrolase [Alphaproteobacteria bacterium]
MSNRLDHPFAQPPAHAQPIEVAPGILWLRMPLPFQLDHINLWLIEDGDGWTLVDTGFADDTTRALWGQVFDDGLRGLPIRRIVSTHFHPDHIGLAGWLAERWGVELWTTQAEWLYARMLSLDSGEATVEWQVEFYRRAGFEGEMLDLTRRRGNVYRGRVVPIPVSLRRIGAGSTIRIGERDWTVIIGTGHSPEHASLYCAEDDILISGDQVLPKISPIVGVWPQEPEANPLRCFLASLDVFRPLPRGTFVLPSHGLPFRGLHERLDQLSCHHDARLAETLDACRESITGKQLLDVLFRRPLDDHQVFFAIGESLAHLHFLMDRGEVHRERRADGVQLFRKT